MKTKIILFFILLFGVAFLNNVQAQDSTKTKTQDNKQNQLFVDEDGDGYNDNAPDHDNDGIPNSLDPDWIKLQKEEKRKETRRFVDLDGDGIDDNIQNIEKGKRQLGGKMNKTGTSMEERNREQKGQRQQNQNGKK